MVLVLESVGELVQVQALVQVGEVRVRAVQDLAKGWVLE